MVLHNNNTVTDLSQLGLRVADHVTAMLAYWDKDQVCRFANNAYQDWFGKSREEMVDKVTMKELLGPLYEKNLPFIKGALNGLPQHFEREIPTADGEIRYSIASYYPDIVNGEVQGFFVHVADVSNIKKLKRKLAASEKKFRGLLESGPDAVIILSPQFSIEIVNAQTEKLFGYCREELLMQPVKNIFPEHSKGAGDEAEKLSACLQKAMDTNSVIELVGLNKNGK